MRITSTDSKAWVEITPGKSSLSFTIECMVIGGESTLHGKNADLYLQNIEAFATDLDKFILDRNLRPQLNGVYGPCLEFYRSKTNATAVMVRFIVVDDSSAYAENVEFKTTGAFEINAEFLNEYVSGFEELAKAWPALRDRLAASALRRE